MINPLRKIYDWTLAWAGRPHAEWALFWIAFVESSFFPIPPDVLLIPMVVARPQKFMRIALICLVGSVLGALLGYAIGWSFYETIGKRIVEFYSFEEAMTVVGQRYQENAFIAIFTAAFSPIPYKVFTIASGIFNVSLVSLMTASVIGRAGRFFLVAGALRLWGGRISQTVEKYFNWFSIVFIVLLIGGFVLIKYL